MLRHAVILAAALFAALPAAADRIKDLAGLAGMRPNPLVGYGLVVGLTGTGDGNLGLTLQSLQSMVSNFGLSAATSDLNGRNVAAVMVTAELSAFLKPGQAMDVTVSSIGPARSLRGGTLLMTPMMGADGEVYAIAQGNLLVGGLAAEGADGSSVQVNIPTVARIPGGGLVERMVETPFLDGDYFLLNLHRPDFGTAHAVTQAINTLFGPDVAVPLDAASIRVRAPVDPATRVEFVSILQDIEVDPAAPPARVVVSARTGTVIIGGDVRVTPVAVTLGTLTVRVTEDLNVDRGATVTAQNGTVVVTPDDPVITPDSQVDATEETARAFVFDPGVSLASLVDAINAVGASPSDLVAILEALREIGALRAQLVVL